VPTSSVDGELKSVVAGAGGTTAAGAEQRRQPQFGGHGFGLTGFIGLGAAGAFFEHFAQHCETCCGVVEKVRDSVAVALHTGTCASNNATIRSSFSRRRTGTSVEPSGYCTPPR
jgi:hypothetical protein